MQSAVRKKITTQLWLFCTRPHYIASTLLSYLVESVGWLYIHIYTVCLKLLPLVWKNLGSLGIWLGPDKKVPAVIVLEFNWRVPVFKPACSLLRWLSNHRLLILPHPMLPHKIRTEWYSGYSVRWGVGRQQERLLWCFHPDPNKGSKNCFFCGHFFLLEIASWRKHGGLPPLAFRRLLRHYFIVPRFMLWDCYW